MGATKHNGKGLSLTVDGTQFNGDGTSVVMDREDADTESVVFSDLDNGTPQQVFFDLTCLQDPGANTFFTMLEENAGADDIAFVYRPFGVGTGKPSWAGTLSIPRKPRVGGQAGSTWDAEARLNIDGEPTKTLQS